MRCPFCASADSRVVDSRDSETGEAIRRRRECLACAKRFTTYERVDAAVLFVLKKDGRREEFNRDKLRRGLRLATTKRDVAPAQIEQLIEEVENGLRTRNLAEIPSDDVGEMVMERLRELDEIAYVRFASVYRSFKDAEQMRDVIEEVLSSPPGLRTGAKQRRRGGGGDQQSGVLNLGK